MFAWLSKCGFGIPHNKNNCFYIRYCCCCQMYNLFIFCLSKCRFGNKRIKYTSTVFIFLNATTNHFTLGYQFTIVFMISYEMYRRHFYCTMNFRKMNIFSYATYKDVCMNESIHFSKCLYKEQRYIFS